jgi:hypothetical protein
LNYYENPAWNTIVPNKGYLEYYEDEIVDEFGEYICDLYVQWYENENEDELLSILTNTLGDYSYE